MGLSKFIPTRANRRTRIIPFPNTGDGSTLSLDFTTMSSLDSRFTFSRSTNPTPGASFIGSNGLVQYAGTNQPRFDYTTSGTPRGLLIESSATNLLVRSEDFSATSWTIRANVTTTGNTSDVTDPAGGNTATKVVTASPGATAVYCSVAQSVTVQANTTYTMSFWIRGNAGNQCRVYGHTGGTPIELVAQANYTYSSTGWTRVQTQFATGTFTGIYVYVCSQNVFVGETAKTFYIWGAQLEAGSGASSYVFSGTSQGQRASDSMYMDGANFSAWWPSGQAEYTMYIAGDITRSPATTQFLWLARTGSGGIGSSLARTFITTSSSIRGNNTINDMTSGLSATANTPFKVALAIKNADQAISVNNGTTTALVSATDTGLATNAAQLVFNPATDAPVFQHISSLKFWPSRLPNATLQSLTA